MQYAKNLFLQVNINELASSQNESNMVDRILEKESSLDFEKVNQRDSALILKATENFDNIKVLQFYYLLIRLIFIYFLSAIEFFIDKKNTVCYKTILSEKINYFLFCRKMK